MAASAVELKVPLLPSQVRAAGKVHRKMTGWRATDQALTRLREAVPGYDVEACLLKLTAVNALYGTRLLAVDRMARHVVQVLHKVKESNPPDDLVEKIAALRDDGGRVPRMHLSFASKFAHFFVNEDRFPILDSAAETMIRYHLGRTNIRRITADGRYVKFRARLAYLAEESGFSTAGREIDRYLWIAGLYREFRLKNFERINKELLSVFKSREPGIQELLKRMTATHADLH